jgi:hypothetical protein
VWFHHPQAAAGTIITRTTRMTAGNSVRTIGYPPSCRCGGAPLCAQL